MTPQCTVDAPNPADTAGTVRIAWDAVDGGDRRAVSRRLIGMLVGEGPVTSGPCARCGGPHGRPRVDGFEISVTYAGGIAVVAAIATASGIRIGIDAEAGPESRMLPLGLLRPDTSVQDWTRIEAAAKADGRGLNLAPEHIAITPTETGWRAESPEFGSPIDGVDVDGPAELVVSLASVRTDAARSPGAASAATACGRSTS